MYGSHRRFTAILTSYTQSSISAMLENVKGIRLPNVPPVLTHRFTGLPAVQNVLPSKGSSVSATCLTGNRSQDEAGYLFHDGINCIQIITLPKNRDSSVFRSVAKSPYQLRYPGSENHQRSLWYSPCSKTLAPRCEQIYFILFIF